jgi:hypothetical protein
MTTEERLHERRETRIAAGREAYQALHNHEHFRQWVAIADALVALREEAMEQAHTNRPQGPPYRRAFTALIEQRETWVAGINDTTRAHCYWLVDNLPAVTAWREVLTFRQRDEWNHPSTIKRNFERMTKVQDPQATVTGLSPVAEARQTIVQLQEDNDRLSRELARARDDGSLFNLATDTAEQIGRVIGNTVGETKATAIARAINATVKAKRVRRAHAS